MARFLVRRSDAQALFGRTNARTLSTIVQQFGQEGKGWFGPVPTGVSHDLQQ
jgi:hypothetical protein